MAQSAKPPMHHPESTSDKRVRPNLISRKKELYPLSEAFLGYQARYGRLRNYAIRYEDLQRYNNAIPLYDEKKRDTLWSTVFYPQSEQAEIHNQLREAYAILKANGDLSAVKNLYIDRVDLCLYANTLPFRIRIVNALNENFDYFYVKRLDANRIYGLELEHVLSPSRISYFLSGNTLIEEHIIGIPAELFIQSLMPESRFDQVRLAKEFVKFNERCLVRLLGDMHAGNFVIDIRLDLEKWHYQMRPIDFDQQTYHRNLKVYRPQFYSTNNPIIKVGFEHLAPENVVQYQKEERSLIANRVRVSHGRFDALMEVMRADTLAPISHVIQLREQMAAYYQDGSFSSCSTMGDLVHASIQHLLKNYLAPASP